MDDGQVKTTQKIFKIIEERDTEFDLIDDGVINQDNDDIERSKDVNKDLYKSIYRKSKKLVKRSVKSS